MLPAPTPRSHMSAETPAASSALQTQILGRLAKAGIPDDARNWLVKSLHPASGLECPGIPDSSLVTAVRTDYRTTVTISAQPAWGAGNWDLLLVQTPGDVNNVFWAAGPAGIDFTSAVAPGVATAGVLSNQTMNFTAPYNAQFFPVNAASYTIPLGSQVPAAAPWAWRPRYMGMTAYLVASALYDQGTVYGATFPAVRGKGGLLLNPNVTDRVGDPLVVAPYCYNVPLDEESLQLLSPRPYVSPARAGIYLPARYDGPIADYVSPELQDGRTIEAATGGTSGFIAPCFAGPGNCVRYSCVPALYPTNFGATGLRVYGAWPTQNALSLVPPASIAPPMDTGYARMTVGVVIFRGLASQASVTVRTMAGYEVVPTVPSDQRVFTRPAGDFSQPALTLYHEIVATLEQGYPSSYNALGQLLGVVGSVLGKIFPFIRGVAAAAPVVAQAAAAVPAVVKSAKQAFIEGARPEQGSAAPPLSQQQRVTVQRAQPVAMKKKKKATGKLPRRK